MDGQDLPATEEKECTKDIVAHEVTSPSGQASLSLAHNTNSTARLDAPMHHAKETIPLDNPQPYQQSVLTSAKEAPRKLLGIQEYETRYTGDRNHDYEFKYPPDKPGQEMGPDARVWKVYMDEADSYDDDMIKGFRDTLDALLVFAALFSAVVTSFAVESRNSLKPDQATITSYLLFEQVQLLRANGNATALGLVSSSQFSPNTLSYSTSDLWMNGLFFTSLALSLLTALLSVLAKQWLQAYSSVTSGTIQDRALIRHFRFTGLTTWKVPEIINTLPLVLHSSLALFLSGLILFVHTLLPELSWLLLGITAAVFMFYVSSVLLPAIFIQCPYRISVLYRPIKAFLHPFEAGFHLLRPIINRIGWYGFRATQFRTWARLRDVWGASLTFVRQISDRIISLLSHSSSTSETPWPESSPFRPSIKEAELRLLRWPWGPSEHMLTASLPWLYENSTNQSVHRIVIKALPDLQRHVVSSGSHDVALQRHLKYLTSHPLVRETYNRVVASLLSSTLEDSGMSPWIIGLRALHTLAQLYDIPIDPGTGPTAVLARAAESGRPVLAAYALDWGADVNALHEYNRTALHIAASGGNVALTRILLERDADPNYVTIEQATPLHLAASQGHLEVVKLLIEWGAWDSTSETYGSVVCAAASSGVVQVVELCLESGMEIGINVPGRFGTALNTAETFRFKEVAALLRRHGASVV